MNGFDNCLTFVDSGSMSQRRWPGKFMNCASLIAWISIILSGIIYPVLLVFAQPARADADQPKLIHLSNTENPHPHFVDADIVALREYAQQIGAEHPEILNSPQNSPHTHCYDADLAALREYAQQIEGGQPNPASTQLRVAEADNAFDALREFLQRGTQPNASPNSTPGAPPKKLRPVAPRHDPPFINAHPLGTKTCLLCHARQADSFGKTLMGRIDRTQRGKFDCENCHGPGSAHVQAVGCAACHGEGGITRWPGIPSLVGQDPQYLVPAMKAYGTGQRKSDLMKTVLSGIGEAELNNIALYYARQIPARAQTPPVGDPSAGARATALCAGCHGEQGVSVVPAFPSLAGQDAKYLADAIRAYKYGSRSKVIACAACHGEGGISKIPGMPSLVGQDPQYLVSAMRAYTNGQRKHEVMKALLSGVAEAELNSIALYYARQVPAPARTPPVGDPTAGKTASASCAACHGEQGVSANPEWSTFTDPSYRKLLTFPPSLAGQDAKYLADALKAYKDGSRNDPTMKGIVASIDERTINDIASYFASLRPAQPNPTNGTQTAPAKRDPILVRNELVSFLDERTINDVATYFASLQPAQPCCAKNSPARPDPARVSIARPPDGSSIGGIISFRKDDPSRKVEDNNAICLACHERGQRTYWSGSVHEERGVACSDCHTIMKNVSAAHQLKTPFEPNTCFQCHKDRQAQIFRSSHMPLREGKITCSSCHNPHGSTTEALLKENSINDTCYKCHAEKRGPFLFEHAPVRENCVNCHDPHGSINEFLLKMSRPRLCYECHTIGHPQAGVRSQFTVSRSCQNCHTLIHGSNSPAGAVFQR
jgi:DmsE family decaheme c-type cytochrome